MKKKSHKTSCVSALAMLMAFGGWCASAAWR